MDLKNWSNWRERCWRPREAIEEKVIEEQAEAIEEKVGE
jgi:hypothetical protein